MALPAARRLGSSVNTATVRLRPRLSCSGRGLTFQRPLLGQLAHFSRAVDYVPGPSWVGADDQLSSWHDALPAGDEALGGRDDFDVDECQELSDLEEEEFEEVA